MCFVCHQTTMQLHMRIVSVWTIRALLVVNLISQLAKSSHFLIFFMPYPLLPPFHVLYSLCMFLLQTIFAGLYGEAVLISLIRLPFQGIHVEQTRISIHSNINRRPAKRYCSYENYTKKILFKQPEQFWRLTESTSSFFIFFFFPTQSHLCRVHTNFGILPHSSKSYTIYTFIRCRIWSDYV